ncbi:unnamed protein product [Parascedosporium putredinis]|uniref:C3H1-type domain-containing protein n=1 Tax=Parascedosporium putredinis TaxID=1442378 RepID=A0A9P1MBX3_9PEZI|nr:unnamed protein product [Parascedosporium putredinis]CAI7995591.1 unnamed protein product [Parascedosporium putredinis]
MDPHSHPKPPISSSIQVTGSMAQIDGAIASNTALCDRSALNFTSIPSSGALSQDQILYSPDMGISRHASGYALHGSKARTASSSNRPANPTRPQQCPASAQTYHNGQQAQSLRPLVGMHNSQAQQIFQNAQQHYAQYHSLPSIAGESPGSSRMGAVSSPATTSALRPASSSWRAVFEEPGMQLVSSTPAHNYGNGVNGPTDSELGALSTYEKAATFSKGTGRSGTTELLGSIPGPLLDTSFAYCYDRGTASLLGLSPPTCFLSSETFPGSSIRPPGVASWQNHIDQIIKSAPMRRPKIYCDKWVHEGVCAFTQQGCKYKHEMPFDRQTQHQLGLFHGLPAWWKKHQVELQRQREPEEPVSPISAPPGEGMGSRLPSLPTEQQHVWKLEGTKREVIQVHSPASSGTPSTGSQSSPPLSFASRRPAQSVSSAGQSHGPKTPSPSTDDKTPEQRTVGFQGSP